MQDTIFWIATGIVIPSVSFPSWRYVIAAGASQVCFPVQSTTIGRRAQRPDTEIGSSRYGRCGSFSIEFCSRLSWISIRDAADAQASQEARLLTEAADHRQAALTCLAITLSKVGLGTRRWSTANMRVLGIDWLRMVDA